ncbi:MAG: nitroreductase [Ruminococcus sp.]|nr:nitroreductase [Ruminococcus sp.]
MIKSRRSVKSFSDKPVPKKIIDAVIEAGLYAPSGMGKQSPIIVAVTEQKTRDRLSQLNSRYIGADIDPFYGAPAVLVVLADRNVPTYLYDGSLTMGNMLLAAHALGIGGCWIHRAKQVFDSPEGKEILKSLGIEGDYEGIGDCVLGYPADDPKPAAERKPNRVYYI